MKVNVLIKSSGGLRCKALSCVTTLGSQPSREIRSLENQKSFFLSIHIMFVKVRACLMLLVGSPDLCTKPHKHYIPPSTLVVLLTVRNLIRTTAESGPLDAVQISFLPCGVLTRRRDWPGTRWLPTLPRRGAKSRNG